MPKSTPKPGDVFNAPLAILDDPPSRLVKTIEWDESGKPVPVIVRKFDAPTLKEIPFTALAMPYLGVYDENTGLFVKEPMFEGMTNGEVMYHKLAMRAAQGDLKATEMVLDRAVGKPNQTTTSFKTEMTYSEYLEAMAKKTDEPINITPDSTPEEEEDYDHIFA